MTYNQCARKSQIGRLRQNELHWSLILRCLNLRTARKMIPHKIAIELEPAASGARLNTPAIIQFLLA